MVESSQGYAVKGLEHWASECHIGMYIRIYLQIFEGNICMLSISIHSVQHLLIVGVVASVIVVAGTIVCPVPAKV